MGFIWELSPEYRIVLLLKYYEEMKLEEIADCLECKVGTVKSRLSRGKAALRRRMSGRELLGIVLVSSGVGMRYSITSYAKDRVLSEAAAASIWDSSKAALGIRPDLVFCGSVFKAVPLFVKGGIIGASALMLAATGAFAGVRPVITVVYPTETYTNEAIPVTIHVDSWLPVKSIQITGAGDRHLDYWSSGEGSYGTKINQNGQYKVKAVLLNGEWEEKVFEIGLIDHELPELDWYSWNTDKKLLYCRIVDRQSGIDYARIYKEAADGSIEKPISYDRETGRVEFPLSDQEFYIYLYDKSGNFAKYRIEKYEE